MMGQQEATMTVATEEKGGGTLRRMVLVLAAATLMAVMMALSAMPAFASATKCQGNGCSFGRDVSQFATGEELGELNLPSGHASGQGQANARDFPYGTFPPGQHRD